MHPPPGSGAKEPMTGAKPPRRPFRSVVKHPRAHEGRLTTPTPHRVIATSGQEGDAWQIVEAPRIRLSDPYRWSLWP
jgi:hypothetical protein